MELLNFVKNIGQTIFADNDNDNSTIAEKIKAHIESDKLGLDDLNVNFKDGVVNLSGVAKTSADIEKAVLLAGNIHGVAAVNIDNIAGEKPATNVDYYVIEKGDSLWKVAQKMYNDGSQYERIFSENREVIKDPDLIFPGQKIRIPK